MRHTLLCFVLMLAVCAGDVYAACTQEAGGVLSSVLTWNVGDTIDPVGIFRGLSSGGPYTQIGTAPAGALSYTDTVTAPTATSGSVTYYYVIDYQSAAAGNSPNSNEVCKSFFPLPPAPAGLGVK